MSVVALSHTRRLFTAIVAGLVLGAPAAYAAPVAAEKTQAAAYYRQAVGEHVVTAVYDGYASLSPKSLSGLDDKEIQNLMAHEFQKRNTAVQASVNAFVVQTKTNLVLIDAGSSDCFGPTMGRMVDNIKAAGFKTEDFDTVLLTHMHPDHACGITAPDGTAVFPNATVWADKDDADFWLSKEAEGKLPQDQRVFVKMSQNAVAPYLERGRFKVFNSGDAIVPGISIVPSAGHTPGHTSYMLTSAADKMLIWGDIIHFHAVQLPHPEVSIEVDIDAKRAIESRQRILAEAAKNDWMIGGAHLPFPGMGHVRAEKTGYSWTPIEYAPLPGLLK